MSYREVLFVDKLAKDAKLTLHKLLQNRRGTLWGETPVLFRVRKYKVAGEIRNERVTVVKPQLHRVKLYSQLLRKFIPLQLTPQMLRYVEGCGGLDDYLLNTPDNKLKSNLASSLKVQLLNLKAELRSQSTASLKTQQSRTTTAETASGVQSPTGRPTAQDMPPAAATSKAEADTSSESTASKQTVGTEKDRKGKQGLGGKELLRLKEAREQYERERRDRVMKMLQAAAAAGGPTQILAKRAI